MALILKDRVKETCTGTSGDMALTGAVSGYVAFDADSTFDGNTTYYALEDADGTKWEVGLGTLSADSTTLTRTTILATQASFTDTTRQTFSSGTHTIYCVYPAGKSVHLDSSGDLSHTSGKIISAGYAISAVVTESGTSRTLADSDNGKVIVCTNGSATTITVPASLATGFAVTVIQTGAGQITFSASSTTINNRQSHTKTAGQHARVGLVQTSSDTYNLGGDTAS